MVWHRLKRRFAPRRPESATSATPLERDPLPEPRAVDGAFFRWHNPRYLAVDDFWRTFLDGDFKWLASERYAGKLYNCGHYFALTEAGARAEAAHYNADYLSDRVLLEIRAAFDSVLDLTDPPTIRRVLSLFHTDPEWPFGRPFPLLLQYLVDQTDGGNSLTSDIGRWAREEGYDAILFYSARCLTSDHWHSINHPSHWAAFLGVEEEEIDAFRRDRSLLNLVVLSGARLTMRTEAFRVLGPGQEITGGWRRNPYHGSTPELIDRVYAEHGCPFGSEYQEEMKLRGILTTGPTVVEPVLEQVDPDGRRPGA